MGEEVKMLTKIFIIDKWYSAITTARKGESWVPKSMKPSMNHVFERQIYKGKVWKRVNSNTRAFGSPQLVIPFARHTSSIFQINNKKKVKWDTTHLNLKSLWKNQAKENDAAWFIKEVSIALENNNDDASATTAAADDDDNPRGKCGKRKWQLRENSAYFHFVSATRFLGTTDVYWLRKFAGRKNKSIHQLHLYQYRRLN